MNWCKVCKSQKHLTSCTNCGVSHSRIVCTFVWSIKIPSNETIYPKSFSWLLLKLHYMVGTLLPHRVVRVYEIKGYFLSTIDITPNTSCTPKMRCCACSASHLEPCSSIVHSSCWFTSICKLFSSTCTACRATTLQQRWPIWNGISNCSCNINGRACIDTM